MNDIDKKRCERFWKAFPELKLVHTPEQLIFHLNLEKKERQKIDRLFNKKLNAAL